MPIDQLTHQLIGEIHSDVKTLLARTQGHEQRLRSLELARNWLAGAFAGTVALFGKNLFSPTPF